MGRALLFVFLFFLLRSYITDLSRAETMDFNGGSSGGAGDHTDTSMIEANIVVLQNKTQNLS